MSNEELDSQLSAMFDDELPATECELLARRLARDEQLRGRWGRYAAIGACIRGEHGSATRRPPGQQGQRRHQAGGRSARGAGRRASQAGIFIPG